MNGIFVDYYSAFDNPATERLLHLRAGCDALILTAIYEDRLVLPVIHGWHFGSFEHDELCHSDHRLATISALRRVAVAYRRSESVLLHKSQLKMVLQLLEANHGA